MLDSVRVVVVDGPVPIPPLATMGLEGFQDFEQLNAAGITYLSTYFVRCDQAEHESLHFHELVHVVQWQYLGPERFIMAYALAHLLSSGYDKNPLELMAYDLQHRFEKQEASFDVASLVRSETDLIVPALFARAAEL